jgi:hypothetical protein
MVLERVLSLDLSTKTGYCLGLCSDKSLVLEAYGQVDKIPCPDEEPYPGSYVTWAYRCYAEVEKLIEQFQPDVLIVEEVTKSKNAFSQKILDYLHFLVAKFIQETGIKNIFLQTGDWRKEIGSYMNDAERKKNKEVKDYKEAYEKKHGKKTIVAYDINTGKRIGMIGKKHVTIRLINDSFKDQLKAPLKRKDEDTADGISLVWAYDLRRKRGIYE